MARKRTKAHKGAHDTVYYTPDPAACHPLDEVAMDASGQAMAAALPMGDGVVVGHHNHSGGGSMAVDTRQMTGVGYIDPHEFGTSFPIDLATLPELFQRAGGPGRFRGVADGSVADTASEVLREISTMQASAAARLPGVIEPITTDEPKVAQTLGKPGQGVFRSPSAAFRPAPPPPETAEQPGRLVVYENAQFGQMPFKYHDVVRSGPYLVLVFDDRYKESLRYFPPRSTISESFDDGRGQTGHAATLFLAVMEADGATGRSFEVEPTGVTFTFRHWSFCMLGIVREAEAPPVIDPAHASEF